MPDAVVVDTSARTIDDVVNHIISLVRAARDSS
jgi:cytidylate kinase